MSPKKVIPKAKVTKVLVGIKTPKRSEAIDLTKNGRHYDEAQTAEISEENAENCGVPPLNDD